MRAVYNGSQMTRLWTLHPAARNHSSCASKCGWLCVCLLAVFRGITFNSKHLCMKLWRWRWWWRWKWRAGSCMQPHHQHAYNMRGKPSERLKLMQLMQLICAFCFSCFWDACSIFIFLLFFFVIISKGVSVACWAAKYFELTKTVNCINRCMRWQRAEAKCCNEWLNANSAADVRWFAARGWNWWRQWCGGHKSLNNYSLCSIYSFMLPLRASQRVVSQISVNHMSHTHMHTHARNSKYLTSVEVLKWCQRAFGREGCVAAVSALTSPDRRGCNVIMLQVFEVILMNTQQWLAAADGRTSCKSAKVCKIMRWFKMLICGVTIILLVVGVAAFFGLPQLPLPATCGSPKMVAH